MDSGRETPDFLSFGRLLQKSLLHMQEDSPKQLIIPRELRNRCNVTGLWIFAECLPLWQTRNVSVYVTDLWSQRSQSSSDCQSYMHHANKLCIYIFNTFDISVTCMHFQVCHLCQCKNERTALVVFHFCKISLAVGKFWRMCSKEFLRFVVSFRAAPFFANVSRLGNKLRARRWKMRSFDLCTVLNKILSYRSDAIGITFHVFSEITFRCGPVQKKFYKSVI